MKRIVLIQIVEDYDLIKHTLKQFLNKQNNLVVTDSFSTITEYLNQPLEDRPDVLIIDLNFNGSKGLLEIREIKTFSPDTKIIVITVEKSQDKIEELLNAGADECFYLENGYENISEKLKEMFKV